MLRPGTSAILPEGTRSVHVDRYTACVRSRRSRNGDEPGTDSRSVLQGEPATARGQSDRELPRRSLHRGGSVLHDESEANAVSRSALLHEAVVKGCASTRKKVRLASPSRWRE